MKLFRRQKYFEEKQFYSFAVLNEDPDKKIVEFLNQRNLVHLIERISDSLEEVQKILFIKFKKYDLFGCISLKSLFFGAQFIYKLIEYHRESDYDHFSLALNLWLNLFFKNKEMGCY